MFENLGSALRLLREQAGLSQTRVAREAGMSKSQLSKYETRKELPKLGSLEKILRVLAVEPLWLFYTADLLSRQIPGEPAIPLLQSAPSPFLHESEEAAFRGLFEQLLNLYKQCIEASVLRAARQSGQSSDGHAPESGKIAARFRQ